MTQGLPGPYSHREDFVWTLRSTVELARRAGMAKLGVVTVDGRKLRPGSSGQHLPSQCDEL